MTLLARKIEPDEYANLREIFPRSQKSVDALERSVDLEGGKLIRYWFDMWRNGVPQIFARFSVNGEMRETYVNIVKD